MRVSDTEGSTAGLPQVSPVTTNDIIIIIIIIIIIM